MHCRVRGTVAERLAILYHVLGDISLVYASYIFLSATLW